MKQCSETHSLIMNTLWSIAVLAVIMQNDLLCKSAFYPGGGILVTGDLWLDVESLCMDIRIYMWWEN